MAVQQVKTVVGGLVLRVTDTKESDKILTVLTAELGRTSPEARGRKTAVWRRPASCLPGRK